jgi:GT2 family glycosyltransferase
MPHRHPGTVPGRRLGRSDARETGSGHPWTVNLSVVVPTHQRRALLPTILEPLLADGKVGEVIVVVDGGDDGSIEWLRERAGSAPTLVPVLRQSPGGAQVARADGFDRSVGDVVLFLDDDVLASPGLAAAHLAHHTGREGVVVVGYMPVRLPSTRHAGDFPTSLYATEYECQCGRYDRDPSGILRDLWWGNVSMRREDVARVGMTDPTLGAIYHEDKDFGIRCLKAGMRGEFDRSLAAIHLHERDLDGFIRDSRSQGIGRLLLQERHPEITGDPDVTQFESGLRQPAALLVRAAGHPRVGEVLLRALRSLVALLGRLRCLRLELLTARLLRRVAQRRGAETVLRGAAQDDAPTDRLSRSAA